ncbi:MAG TPA: DUF4147 domain-containing protein [Gammaproteobacteria bacterium]|nr:DUF4147 domain-containing protein [Gammaproteobacteria bacterium]
MSNSQRGRKKLLEWYQYALSVVDGRRCVRNWLAEDSKFISPDDIVYCIATGKAACAMMQGVVDSTGPDRVNGLVISCEGSLESSLCSMDNIDCLESSHPVPAQSSLDAGQTLLRWLGELPADATVLFLLSGGTSSLVEVLPAGISLDDLVRANNWLLGSGLAIDQINVIRRCLSAIKGGGLRQAIGQREATVLMISDVPGDDPAIVGSGLLYATGQRRPADLEGLDIPDWLMGLCRQTGLDTAASEDMGRLPAIPHHCIAGNADARQAIAEIATRQGYRVHQVDGLLEGDAVKQGRDIALYLSHAAAGVWIWGGETTVQLPDQPGQGGRNQNLALAAAMGLSGRQGIALLAAGSDGVDGNTDDAGALIDGWTLASGECDGYSADECLRKADAGSFLHASGDLIHVGPTGTNVMDLTIVLIDGENDD